jgi:hypothetical protein
MDTAKQPDRDVDPPPHAPSPYSSRGAKNQVRIRGPKPGVSIFCASLAELEGHLRQQYVEGRRTERPTLIHSQFQFSADVSLPISGLSDELRLSYGLTPTGTHDGVDTVVQLRVGLAIAPLDDAKMKLRRQRAVSRQILQTIQGIDDFRYLEKEAWDTKHFDGYRFKYLCRDSFQNKDRVSNRNRTSGSAADSSNGIKSDKDGRGEWSPFPSLSSIIARPNHLQH